MKNYFTEALEIVRAQASVRTMTEEDIVSMVMKLAEKFRVIGDAGGNAVALEDSDGPIDPRKAIKEKSITCVICGKSFKLITKKHLASHGLTVEEYRKHCDYKKGMPLVCKFLQRERRKKMQDMRLWERRKI
ncbi:MAG: MucR family transcriptional regulator [Desulfovibrio sp.]|jgi:predicted transcriptional regulator|nr:MucR family transcriptional regulator [Desulfovibrio sp.]